MILPDVNVLVYAHRADAPNHAAYHRWLAEVINRDQAYGLSDMVLRTEDKISSRYGDLHARFDLHLRY